MHIMKLTENIVHKHGNNVYMTNSCKFSSIFMVGAARDSRVHRMGSVPARGSNNNGC